MSTYQTLRDRALGQVGLTGQTEAQTVAQTALEEAMKYVAFNVRVASLVGSATATAPASPELEANAIALEGGAGTFQISAGVFQTPDRLYVKKDSSAESPGLPYDFLEYDHFLDLKAIPAGERVGIFEPATFDERPNRVYTLTPSGKIWAQPLTEDNVLTLFYRKSPAAYSGGSSPEILPQFEHILVNGAVIALKEWLREPAEITTLWTLFENGLKKDVQTYDDYLNSRRKRKSLRIHRSYRVE